MGYWATSLSGESLQIFGDVNPDGSEMLWGDAPADHLDEGMDNLILRLTSEMGRYPTVEEVDAVKANAPEMAEAITKAKKVFAQDIEREATDGEIAAGLAFCDTEISLDCAMRRDIKVGDTVRWAVMRDAGFFREIDYIAEGVVSAIERRQVTSSWSDKPYTKDFLVIRREDSVDDMDAAWANKVLPGDEPIDQVNAKRMSR